MPKKKEIVPLAPEAMKIDEALRFLVRFANAQIDDLKRRPDDPEGLPAILYLLHRYLDVSGEADLTRALNAVRSHPDKLKNSIKEVRRLLTATLQNRLDETEFVLKKSRKIRLVLRDGELRVQRDGDLHETLIDTAFEDLAETKIELLRLGKCQRQGCENFFFKVKLNQAYCDHQCANRAAAARRTKGSDESSTAAERAADKQDGAKS